MLDLGTHWVLSYNPAYAVYSNPDFPQYTLGIRPGERQHYLWRLDASPLTILCVFG